MGSFVGHIFSGLTFAGFGFIFCYLIIVQFIKEQHGNDGKKEMHQPLRLSVPYTANITDTRNDFITRIFYRNPGLLIFSVVCGCILILIERAPFGLFPHTSPFHKYTHMFIYGVYTLSSVAALLERKGYLPYTSCTWMLAAANWFAYKLWMSHATMQKGSEAIFHGYIGDVCLIGSFFTVLAALLQLSKQHDFLHVPLFLSFYTMICQGLVLWCVAISNYRWYKPTSGEFHQIELWQPPCIFIASVLMSMAFFAVVWNCVQCRESKNSNKMDDTDSEESLPLSTESDPLSAESDPLSIA